MLTNCGKNDRKSEDKTVFRYNSDNGISSLDPAFARTQDNIWAVSQLFCGLLQLDSGLNTVPCIAKRWYVSEDGLEYTFVLRDDVFFHRSNVFGQHGNGTTGRKVKASDFVYSFSRLCDPATASPGAWIFNDKVADNPFRAIDDTTFKLILHKRFPPLPGLLTMPYCFVIPHEAVEKYGKDFGRNPVGTGPFEFRQWIEEVKLIFHRNPHYFEFENEKRLPFVDAVAVSFLSDKQTAFLEFLQRKSDMFSGLESSFKDEILERDGRLKEKYSDRFKTLITPFLNTEYLGMLIDDSLPNSVNHPLYNRNLRLAIQTGINKKAIINYLRNNIGHPADGGFIPAGLSGYNPRLSANWGYNPKLAKAYLEKSGYLAAPQKIVLYTTKDYLDIALFVQKDLRALGIRLEIEVQPASFLKEQKSSNALNFYRGSWIADYPDAENYLACFYGKNFSPSGPNYSHFRNKIFDELYASIFTSQVNDRAALYEKMDSVLMETCPVIPLYYDQSLRLISNKVVNLRNNATNSLDLRRVQILP